MIELWEYKYPVSSSVLNMEKDKEFYKQIYADAFNIDSYKKYKHINFDIEPKSKLHYLNIFYNFIKLVQLLYTERFIIEFNKNNTPSLRYRHHGVFSIDVCINMLVNNLGKYIITVEDIDDANYFPAGCYVIRSKLCYAQETIEQLLNQYTCEQFMSSEHGITRLIPDILKIVYEYAN